MFEWPEGIVRIPDDEWTTRPPAELAIKYDTVEHHGWYRNLDRTVDQLNDFLADDHLLVDYSAGTGILEDRLLRSGPRYFGVMLVDASPKFLRVALEKFRKNGRIGYRWIRFLKEEKRLEMLDEVMDGLRADAIVSTNAIHLYYGLPETLDSWNRSLKDGGRVFVQSGNIRNPTAKEGEWIIDETVAAIHKKAKKIVRNDDRYAKWRPVIDDKAKLKEYRRLRKKYFLPVRPLDHYVSALEGAGFTVDDVSNETIEARVVDWYEFLSTYHEGVLGWAGGVEKIEGRPPTDEDVRDRLALMKSAMELLFEGRDSFNCCWTYITCRK